MRFSNAKTQFSKAMSSVYPWFHRWWIRETFSAEEQRRWKPVTSWYHWKTVWQYNNGGCFITVTPVLLSYIFLVRNNMYFLNVSDLILRLLVVLLHYGLSCFTESATSQPMQLELFLIIYLYNSLIVIFPNTSERFSCLYFSSFSWR